MRFVWTQQNIAHIARHGLTPELVEAVFLAPDFSQQQTEREERWIAEGTLRGKLYRIVYARTDDESVYPITAHRMSRRTKR